MPCIIRLVAVAISLMLSTHNVQAGSDPFFGAARSDSVSRDIQDQFQRLTQRWLQGYNANDSAALAGLYTEDAQYISSHVEGLVARGRDRIIANFRNGIRMGGHIESITVLGMQASCDLATLLCRYEANNSGQKAVGRNVLVLRKIGLRWQIVLHMTVV